jgi:hypothetical protein
MTLAPSGAWRRGKVNEDTLAWGAEVGWRLLGPASDEPHLYVGRYSYNGLIFDEHIGVWQGLVVVYHRPALYAEGEHVRVGSGFSGCARVLTVDGS